MLSARPHRQFLWLLLSVAAINLLAGFLLVSISSSFAGLSLRRALLLSWIVSSGLIVLGGAIVVWAAQGALEQISKGLEQLRAGRFPRLVVPETNPWGRYVREVNEMSEELRQRDEKTRRWAERRQSELEKASRLLRMSDARLHTVSRQPEGLLLLDSANRVSAVNQVAADLLGGQVAEIAEQPFSAIAARLRQTTSAPAEFERQCALLDEGSIPELRLGPDQLGGASLTISRISSAEAPSPGRAAAQESDAERMKSEFISTVSHELRTPLTAIKGSLSLIRSGSSGHIPIETRDLLEIALNNTDRMIATVNNMLDVTQLEAGAVQYQVGPVVLQRVLNDAIQAVTPDTALRKTAFEVSIPDPSPIIYADGKRIAQVLGHLLSNAVKFSAEGSTVRVSAQTDGQKVTVAVADSGVGMSPDFIARLFRRFEHEKEILTRETQGCGLGLAISRLIVEAHGGRIWAESSPGAGSTLFFTVPVAKPSQQPAILVVDSDEDLRPSLDEWCATRGYRLLACHNPAEVVQFARRWRPRLVVLDLDVGASRDIYNRLAGEPETQSIAVVCFDGQNTGRATTNPNLHLLTKPLNATDLDNVAELAANLAKGNGA